MKYYDRSGEEIDQKTFSELEDSNYPIILRDFIGEYIISTVWIGFDYNVALGKSKKPLIFETSIFKGNSFDDVDSRMYSTEKEAINGHNHVLEIVNTWVGLVRI